MPYLLALSMMCAAALTARDFGSFGTTYPILEEDLIEVLQKRLKKDQLDDQWYKNMQKAFVKTIDKPKGRGLPKATVLRAFDFDPTLTLHEDIRGSEGELIVSKGTKINPLETNRLPENLLFFDGDDTDQVSWARKTEGLWVLTNGSPIALEEQEKRSVYFDQAGYLTGKLGIQALPAKVSQSDKTLKVEEVPCN